MAKYGNTLNRKGLSGIKTPNLGVLPRHVALKRRRLKLSSNFKASGTQTKEARGSVWFDKLLSTDSYTVPDSARFDFPNSDWFVAALVHVKDFSGTRYIFSIGTQGGQHNLQLYLSGTAINAQFRTNVAGTAIPVSGALTAGWYVVGVQRNGNNIEIFTCPLNGAATFGTAGDLTVTSNAAAMTPTGTHTIGVRTTSQTSTWWHNNISWIAKGSGILSGAEIALLASGSDILTDLGKTMTNYYRFDEALATIPNSIVGNIDPLTKTGTPLTRGGPPLAGLPIRIDGETTDQWGRVHQRAAGGTSKTMTFSGDYLGNPSKGIEARVIGTNNAQVVAWKKCTSPSAGRWTVNLTVPQAALADYILEVRFVGQTTKYHRTFYPFGVGMVIWGLGQSNMNNLATSGVRAVSIRTGSVYTGGAWRDSRITNYGCGFSELLFHVQANENIAVTICNGSTSGSALTGTPNTWSDLAGTVWATANAALAACGGDAEKALWHQGEADAASGVSEINHYNALLTLGSNIRARVGRTAANLPIFSWILGHAGSVQANTTWRNQRNALMSWIANGTNVKHLSSAYVLDLADALHYVTTQNGYVDMGCMMAQAILNYDLPGTFTTGMAGPFVTGVTRSGNDVIVTFDLNGNSSLFIPTASPANLDAVEVRNGADVLQTISSWSVSGNQLTLNMAATPAAGWKFDYVWRDVLRPNGAGNYAITDNDNMLYGSNSIVGTSRKVPVLPMTAQIILA